MVIRALGPKRETRLAAKKFRFASGKMFRSASANKLCSSECQNSGNKKGFRFGTIRTSHDCFLDGNSQCVHDYESKAVRQHVEKNGENIESPSEVVKLAYNELQRNDFCAGYDLLGRNCEYFATKCKTGLAFSMLPILRMAKITASFTERKRDARHLA